MIVQLRRLQPGDLDAVHALTSRMDVVRYMLLPVCSREESEKFVRDAIGESPSEPCRSVVRAIFEPPTGAVVGLCGVVILRGAEEGEIWYLVESRPVGTGNRDSSRARALGESGSRNSASTGFGRVACPKIRHRLAYWKKWACGKKAFS